MDLTAPGRAKSASADIARKSAGEVLFSCEGIYLDLGGREILRDISLSVSAGEVLGIIGPNGAGKTSLFEVLSGRIPAKSGQVWFRGAEITELPLHDRARLGIGRTYQTPVVPDELTVGQSLKAARQAFRPYLTRHHAEWGTELVGLDVDYDLPTSQLDTLDRRKLLLACLLMRRPSVLLMDEPAAGLINSEVDELDDLIRVLSKEMNFAVIIVEHRIELLETIADRVMVMDAGETISQGSLADVLLDPKVHAAYFERVEEDAPLEIERPRADDGKLADTAASPDLAARDTAEREVLRISGLSAGYGPMRVIHDLDLVVKAGECVGLVGLNGHGKSTLFLAIAGLTGWQRGSIQLNGMEVGRTRSQGPGRYTHQPWACADAAG